MDQYSHCRWCNTCNQYHGILYKCEHYSDELKQQLQKQTDQLKDNLMDPSWCKEQIDNGATKEALMFFRVFSCIGD